MIPHIILGALSTAWTGFFFQIKIKKKSIYSDKENQYKKKKFR